MECTCRQLQGDRVLDKDDRGNPDEKLSGSHEMATAKHGVDSKLDHKTVKIKVLFTHNKWLYDFSQTNFSTDFSHSNFGTFALKTPLRQMLFYAF
jgi:hypothetical protein